MITAAPIAIYVVVGLALFGGITLPVGDGATVCTGGVEVSVGVVVSDGAVGVGVTIGATDSLGSTAKWVVA